MKIIKTMKRGISFEEIARAMREKFDGPAQIVECINDCTGFLAAIPISQIMEMTKGERTEVGEALLVSAGQFNISEREYEAIATGNISP